MNRFLKPPDRILNALSSAENDVYDYLIDNAYRIGEMNIISISNATYCSPSTVFNVLKKLGYSGFKEFKYECKNYQKELDLVTPSSSMYDEVYSYIADRKSMVNTIDMQNFEQVKSICNELYEAKRTLVIANEITRFVASDFAYRMQLCNIDIITSFDVKQYEVLLKNRSYDYIVVFSKYGNTDKIISAFESANRCIDVLVTANSESYLSKLSNSVLIGNNDKIDPLINCVGDIGSRLSLHIISDILVNTFVYLYLKKEIYEEN